jgi:signal peptidase I
MKASLPAQTKHTSPWEGGAVPPLRLIGRKPGVVAEADLRRALEAPAKTGFRSGSRALSRRSWLLRNLLVFACVLAFSLPAYYLASRFIVTAVVIQGRSMTPTLKDGERYFLNRWRYFIFPPERGDMVVIKDPGHADFAVKRIVGKPKDWLNLRDGMIFVNGKRLNEPYLPTGTRTDAPDMQEKWIQLGQDQYYVLGDNRKASEDSRYYGVITRAHILGILVK